MEYITAKQDSSARFLKWDDDVIGVINGANVVTFTSPAYNKVVALYTKGADTWTQELATEQGRLF